MNKRVNKTLINTIASTTLLAASFSGLASHEVNDFNHSKELPYQSLTEKQEKMTTAIGLSSGVVLGAIIAGPIGAGVAGILGAFISDDINDKRKIQDSQHALMLKQGELREVQVAFNHLRQENEAQLAAFDLATKSQEQNDLAQLTEIISNIQFKTASFLIEDHYKAQLDLVASQLRNNPRLKVELSGFADKRGDSTYNQTLSEQRNQAVKNYLMSQWVAKSQIQSQAFGETQVVSTSDNTEDKFFDRRVMMKISVAPSTEMTASASKNM